jgi:5'-deoxynucleotidase YfbR-like HD superfamily hydrolase
LRREEALLKRLSEEIRQCYEHAEECACQSRVVQDEKLRADYLRLEQRWSELARRYELQERLILFGDEAAQAEQ